jgi:hypothetical protein
VAKQFLNPQGKGHQARGNSKNDNRSDTERLLGPWGDYVEKRAMRPREVSRLCFYMAGCTQTETILIFLNYQFEAI